MPENKIKIGVLGGTPTDTRMGASVIKGAGFTPVNRHCSETPEAQNLAQIIDKDGLFLHTAELCSEMAEEGVSGIFIYCNSLAGALDMHALRARVPVKIVTPLDVYENLARNHKKIAVIAANGQSLSAIERVIQTANPDCIVYGCGLMPLVYAIEESIPPEDIAEKMDISGMMGFLNRLGGEILLLGCTHFPYIKQQLCAFSDTPVVDPADDMLQFLLNQK